MVVKFEEPKLISIREILDAVKEGKHYVERFEYGDYDNWVEGAIVDLEIVLKYTKFCPNSIYGAVWSVDVKHTYKSMFALSTYNYETNSRDYDKKWDDVKDTFTGFEDYHVEHLEDIYNLKVEVIGYVTERD